MDSALAEFQIAKDSGKTPSAPKAPRVLLVDHTAALGGGEIALLNLVRHLDRDRHCPVVLLMSDGPLRHQLIDAGVETHLLPLPDSIVNARKDRLGGSSLLRLGDVLKSLWYSVRLSRWIRAHDISIVHSNSLKSDLLGGAAARLAGKPIIWHVRDRIESDYLPPRVVKAFRLASRVLPTRILANSTATLRTVLPPGTPPELAGRRWRVVYDGTPWLPLPVKKMSDVSDGPVIGIVGRLSRWKGQDVFLRAASAVRAKFPTARFRIIGAALFAETDYERSLHQLCQELQCEDCVEFTGFRHDVSAAIAELDVLVHASTLGEPFGQVVIEAMVLGKPVIATRGGGVPEIVVDGVTGLLVPMNDPAAIATALAELLSDPARAAAMGRAGRQRVGERFRIEHVAANVAAVYDELLPAQALDRPVVLESNSCSEPATASIQ